MRRYYSKVCKGKQAEIESRLREAGLPVRSVDGVRAYTSINRWPTAIGLPASQIQITSPSKTGREFESGVLISAAIEKDLVRTIYRIASENPVGAGHPPLIKSNEDKRKIVVAVGQLQIDGRSLGEAQKRIAQRHGIGVRTDEIVWRNRKNIETAEPRTISDLINAFSALSKLEELAPRLPEGESHPSENEPSQ